MSAMTDSAIIAPKNIGRDSFSLFIQRAISGDCVAWKPEIAPHAMLMKSVGMMGSFSALKCIFSSVVSSGMV